MSDNVIYSFKESLIFIVTKGPGFNNTRFLSNQYSPNLIMKKSQRLNVIVELNAKNEKNALQALGDIQKQRIAAKQQLDSLMVYLQDYKDKYQSMLAMGVNVKQLLEFRAFMNKIDKAIEDQQQVIVDVEKQVESARMHWERQHQKTRSMQKVCDAAIKEELKAENKREQNEHDDRATRVGRNSGTRNA